MFRSDSPCSLLLAGLIACGVLLLGSPEASATAQFEEELVIDGLVHRMQSTPLASYLALLEKQPDFGGLRCSALWRGYIGTWTIEDDQLYLLKLRGYAFGAAERGTKDEPDPTIPLSRVFGDRKGPISATWFSGLMRIPRGRRLQYVHMGFGTLYEKTVFLRVEKGRVVKRWIVDNLREGAIRSRKDMQWVAIADEPPDDDGKWHDARGIETEVFRKKHGAGSPFRTRGVISTNRQTGALVLWVPETHVTQQILIPLRGAQKPERALAHVELTAAWQKAGEGSVLDVESLRLLKPGETIHHPKYEIPDLDRKLQALLKNQRDGRDTTPIFDADELGLLHDEELELVGALRAGKVATVHGVEVDGTGAQAGEEVSATGLLQRWFVTSRLLEKNERVAKLFGDRGPGTYHRLVDPRTGALVRARAVDDKVGNAGR